MMVTGEALDLVLETNAMPPARDPISELKEVLLAFAGGHCPFTESENAPIEA
jgi:hypothetical protein